MKRHSSSPPEKPQCPEGRSRVTIAEHWHGIYAKHFGEVEFRTEAAPA